VLIVGDIHGRTESYLKLLNRYAGEPSVQIGDFGVGFVPIPELPDNAWFFPGNHDNRELCRQSSHFLGDYGVREVGGVRFFFLSGAWSIDRRMRIEGKNWWRDEELSVAELNRAVNLYQDSKPDIVLSHDGPSIATGRILARLGSLHFAQTATGQALDAMFDIHQPAKWIFGHWHVNWRETIGSTDFRCLSELGWCQVGG